LQDQMHRSAIDPSRMRQGHPRPDAPLPAVSQRQVISSKGPETKNDDRTHLIVHDRTHPGVRSLLAREEAHVSIRHPVTERRSCASCHQHCSASGRWTDPEHADSFIIDRTHQPSVQSKENSSSTSPTSPPLLKYANHRVYHLVHVY
jgi:hypothetical protein